MADESAKPAVAFDDSTKRTVQSIPLLTVRAGPRDGDAWKARMKEELLALIKVGGRATAHNQP